MSNVGKEKGASITRALEIKETLSNSQRPLSPADLSLPLDIPKPSNHLLLCRSETENVIQLNIRGQVQFKP
jgi:hypothetical protein